MKPYRNPTLLKLASVCPECFSCGAVNHGQVVASHWRSHAFGAGMGQKPHDCCIAYLCGTCHDEIDQRSGDLSFDDRFHKWGIAHGKTLAWLFLAGHLQVHLNVKPVQGQPW